MAQYLQSMGEIFSEDEVKDFLNYARTAQPDESISQNSIVMVEESSILNESGDEHSIKRKAKGKPRKIEK